MSNIREKRTKAIAAIEQMVKCSPQRGTGWSKVEAAHMQLQHAKEAMTGLWRDAQVRPLWSEALPHFWKAFQAAHPPDFWDSYNLLCEGDGRGIEACLQFLEADPWFFRSGYIKESVLRHFKKLDLDHLHRLRLKNVLLQVAQRHDRREFRFYCRLARKIYDANFAEELRDLTQHEDKDVRRRARWMLDACQ